MESMESSAGMSGMWCGYAGDFRYVVRICRWLPVHGVEQVMHPLGRWLVLWKLPSTQLQGSLLLLIGCIKIHLNSFDSFSTIEHPAFPVHVAVSIHMIRQRGFILGRVRDLFPDKPKIKHIEPTWRQGWRCKPPSPITCPGTVKAWIGQNCLGPPLWSNY